MQHQEMLHLANFLVDYCHSTDIQSIILCPRATIGREVWRYLIPATSHENNFIIQYNCTSHIAQRLGHVFQNYFKGNTWVWNWLTMHVISRGVMVLPCFTNDPTTSQGNKSNASVECLLSQPGKPSVRTQHCFKVPWPLQVCLSRVSRSHMGLQTLLYLTWVQWVHIAI